MDRADITQILLEGAGKGGVSREAADEIFDVAYAELRALAHREMRSERDDHTLEPTALLNEVYLRLVDQTRIEWQNRAHFFGIAGRAMRQVLVDHARRKGAAKRGGGRERVLLSDEVIGTGANALDLLHLEEALSKLAERSERMARVVEFRVFAGLSGREIAEALGVSRKTVSQDWRVAAMWLRAHMAGETLP